jgi:hypothetical protein
MGRTLGQIARNSDIPKDALNSTVVKNKLIYFPFHEDEKWRMEILLELLDVRNAAGTVENFTAEETTPMIDHLCTSRSLAYWWRLFSPWPPSFLFHTAP